MFIAVFDTAKSSVALFKCVYFKRVELFDQNPLPNIEFSFAAEEERVLYILLNDFSVFKLVYFEYV